MLDKATPHFDGGQTVTVGKTEVLLYEVSVGREFILNKRIYQTSVTQRPFSAVPLHTSFRHGEKWYKRVAEKITRPLEPNMPFGEPYANSKDFHGVERVFVLDITCRGDA